jgi:hypothetical protein
MAGKGSKKTQLEKAFALPKKAPDRSSVPEADARRFERARPLTSAPNSKLRRPDGGDNKRISGYVPSSIEESVRLRCVKERRSISDALTEALSLWLSSDTVPKT